MVTEIKLLPCPFCGGEAETFEASEDSFSILCTGCGVETPCLPYLTEAIAAWNRRAEQNNTPLALDEIISRCTPKAAELLKNGLFGVVKVCAVEKTTPKTNADRIRGMSDEELAEYIFDLGNGPEYCDGHCAYQDDCNAEGFNYNTCIKGVTDWLRQPVKEEHHEDD